MAVHTHIQIGNFREVAVEKIRTLENIISDAIDCAKKAKRNQKSLASDNHYGNKFNALKIEATNLFETMDLGQPEKGVTVAELLDTIFSYKTTAQNRLASFRELNYILSTSKIKSSKLENFSIKSYISPLLLEESKRGYLVKLGSEINNCYRSECYTASMVMIRRLMEVCIIEVFEGNGIQNKIMDGNGHYFMLETLVDRLLNEGTIKISRPSKKSLPQLRLFGNFSAHGKHFHARRDDLDGVAPDFRVLIEELLRIAKLIK